MELISLAICEWNDRLLPPAFKTLAILSLGMMICMPGRVQAADAGPAAETRLPAVPLEATWLELTVNGQPIQMIVLALLDPANGPLLRAEDLRQLRLHMPQTNPTRYAGEDYYPLAAYAGLRHHVDPRLLTLDLQAPADLFETSRLGGGRPDDNRPVRSPLGAYFNYDLSATQAPDNHSTSGLFELGAFNGWGAGSSSFLAEPQGQEAGSSFVRLDTSWRRDDPENMRTLLLGDTTSHGTSWSGGVRFGGLQWGTNFSTRPEFATLPLLSMSGEASLPSTIDLYVKDALRARREIPAGPFSIDEVPVVTGAGEARLVVRDILGREQVITQSFYASNRLLRPGLQDYSVELGVIRENYGLSSNDYGRLVATATYRQGQTDYFTSEIHGQFLQDQQTVGVGGAWLLPWDGEIHSAVAASRAEGETGQLLRLGLQRQGRKASFGIDNQFASEHFVRLGASSENNPLPAWQTNAFVSLAGFAKDTFSLSYTQQNYRAQQDIEFVSAGYSLGLGELGFLSFSALHFLDDHETSFSLTLTLPLSGLDRTTASINASHRADRRDGTLQLQRSLPVGSGFGYRLKAGLGDSDYREGSLSYQNDFGTYRLAATNSNGQSSTRVDASGGVALLGGGVFASRRISDSFAVVDIPGFSNVRVYAENQEVARTDGKGRALLPRLRSFERNKIRIEQADLPIEANIGNLEQVAIPYARSGIVLGFDVELSRDAFFRIQFENGEALPTGAVVMLENGERFPVGLRGEVFLSRLDSSNRLTVEWRGQTCEIMLEIPDSSEPLLDLGYLTCPGIKP
ncbi:fimbria/pilus outer membrane usher protein [Azotobacter armeniacus]